MDITTKGITLTSYDYKDNDKNILLYTLEHGKISVLAKGIKKPQAKLKYCQQPFCFGDFELNKTHDRYTLTGCNVIESFFDLTGDIERYYCACMVVDSVAVICQEEQSNSKIFAEVLRALQCLYTTDAIVYIVAIAFLLRLLRLEGYAIDVETCSSCGGSSDIMCLDLQQGATLCSKCKTATAVTMPARVVSLLKLITKLDYDQLGNINIADAIAKETLQLLDNYIANILRKVKTISQLIRL